MDRTRLSRLEKVDLRDVWQNEAQDFTPWLAEEENLALLGDTIGIELELEGTEKNVGPFNADILCKDTVEGQWVLIENQLNRTDHTHLGQLLTYAAGLNAVTVVWVARRFTEEHRAALDWLNEITDEGINFFGLEIELWRISDSPVAPKFNLASKPNNWSKTVSRATKQEGELTEVKKLQLDYWTQLAEYLKEKNSRVRPRAPRPRHWASFAVGRSQCRISARVNTRDHIIGVQLLLTNQEEAEPLFRLLKEDREVIEEEIGTELNWLPKPDKKRCVVQVQWSADPTDRNQWPEQHRRLADMLERFHRAFSPRLKRLDPAEYVPPVEEPQAVSEEI